ncbi:hypothetical protein Asp14428_36680 [Actinoplanes sp. NBRC 14428]|nr:hypothetical protein Asp14428_36680 [Actinoplanes sp. NBRC 14428]
MKPTAQDEITAYVFAVRAALGDLPEAVREEMLQDLTEHLTEVMADGEGSLVDRLGSPEVYAAELRNSTPFVGGFPDPPPARHKPFVGLRDQVTPSLSENLQKVREQILPPLRVADVRLGKVMGYERASDFFALLRPAWWVLRGYLVAMILAAALDDGGQPIGLLPRIGGSDAVALMLLAAAVLASIWFGRRVTRLPRWPRFGLYAGSAVLAMVALAGFFDADSTKRDSYYSDVNYDNPYSSVEDVFVYDAEGRLVTGARLFDQEGQPIHLGNAYCHDEQGTYVDAESDVYPYCPSKAPFLMPGVRPSESSEPSAPKSARAKPSATPSR